MTVSAFSEEILDVISRRYSCRKYVSEPLRGHHREAIEQFLERKKTGPFGTKLRFLLLAQEEQDNSALKGLGTYGFIRGVRAFIAGAAQRSLKDLEDFGYVGEEVVLFATHMGLGTCWLGGTFTKSSFAKKIGLALDETMPAVIAIGYSKSVHSLGGQASMIRARRRLPADKLFFEGDFSNPLELKSPWKEVLEAVRAAPSASNKQPWRIVFSEGAFHFYLERSKGYGKGSLLFSLLGLADLQRVDMGIAMCHFELAARCLGLEGSWFLSEPSLPRPSRRVEYIASWACNSLVP